MTPTFNLNDRNNRSARSLAARLQGPEVLAPCTPGEEEGGLIPPQGHGRAGAVGSSQAGGCVLHLGR